MSVSIIWEDDLGAVVTVQLDIDEQEQHQLDSVSTDHPVSQGADISDHVRAELDQFTVEGFVSDTPLLGNPGVEGIAEFQLVEIQIPQKKLNVSLGQGISAGISAATDFVTGGRGPVKAQMLRLLDTSSRKRKVLDLLDEARRSVRRCQILTALRDYDNMFIQQLSAKRVPGDGDGAVFTISLREITEATSDITVAPSPAETTGQATKKAGAKSTKKDDAKKEETKRSLLKKKVLEVKEFFR